MLFNNLNEVRLYVAEEAQGGRLFSLNPKLSATERRRLVREVATWIAGEARKRGFEWGQNWWVLLQCIPVTQQADQRLQDLLTQKATKETT